MIYCPSCGDLWESRNNKERVRKDLLDHCPVCYKLLKQQPRENALRNYSAYGASDPSKI